jgi:hypothetical protein
MGRPDPPVKTTPAGPQDPETKLDTEPDDLACEVLLFIAIQSEREQLESGAKELGFIFEERQGGRVETYFTLGTIGSARTPEYVNELLTKGL